MMPERRRIPDELPDGLDSAVVIMRASSRSTADAVEREIRSHHGHALVELVDRTSGTWIVASATGASADQLWQDARKALVPGDTLERRMGSTGWTSAVK